MIASTILISIAWMVTLFEYIMLHIVLIIYYISLQSKQKQITHQTQCNSKEIDVE